METVRLETKLRAERLHVVLCLSAHPATSLTSFLAQSPVLPHQLVELALMLFKERISLSFNSTLLGNNTLAELVLHRPVF